MANKPLLRLVITAGHRLIRAISFLVYPTFLNCSVFLCCVLFVNVERCGGDKRINVVSSRGFLSGVVAELLLRGVLKVFLDICLLFANFNAALQRRTIMNQSAENEDTSNNIAGEAFVENGSYSKTVPIHSISLTIAESTVREQVPNIRTCFKDAAQQFLTMQQKLRKWHSDSVVQFVIFNVVDTVAINYS